MKPVYVYLNFSHFSLLIWKQLSKMKPVYVYLSFVGCIQNYVKFKTEISTCCFSTKCNVLRSNNKDWHVKSLDKHRLVPFWTTVFSGQNWNVKSLDKHRLVSFRSVVFSGYSALLCHDVTIILLKVVLNTITLTQNETSLCLSKLFTF
jgi:hypothetical protein